MPNETAFEDANTVKRNYSPSSPLVPMLQRGNEVALFTSRSNAPAWERGENMDLLGLEL